MISGPNSKFLWTLRKLFAISVLLLTGQVYADAICVPAPPKWSFKGADAVIVATVKSGGEKCATRVVVTASYKGPLSPGDELVVDSHQYIFSSGCGVPPSAIIHLRRGAQGWELSACKAIATESSEGKAGLDMLKTRAWWWRCPVSSIGRHPRAR